MQRVKRNRVTLRIGRPPKGPRAPRPLNAVDLIAEAALCVLLVLFIATLEGIRP